MLRVMHNVMKYNVPGHSTAPSMNLSEVLYPSLKAQIVSVGRFWTSLEQTKDSLS